MFELFKSYRMLGRYRQILIIVSKYGFGELIGRLRFWALVRGKTRGVEKDIPRARRFRMMLEELGPTFVKFGQLLSTRGDLLPADIVEELEQLQDRVRPADWQAISVRFKHAGLDIEKTFCEFDTVPIAGASLAQVYRARLKSGEEVAVKVLRPNIEEIIGADLMIMEQFADIFSRHFEEAKLWQPQGLIQQFRDSINKELNLIHEGRNAEIFRKNFADDKTIYVPKIYWQYSSSEILVMEFIRGRKISDFFDGSVPLEQRKIIAVNGANAILKQIFEHGFFQADPHPGNGFVLDSGVLCFLDFGMFGRLDEKTLELLAAALNAIVRKDIDRLIKISFKLGTITEQTVIDELRPAIVDMIEQYWQVPLKQINMVKLLQEVVAMVRAHRIHLRSDFMFLIKALSTTESIGRRCDPDFDVISHLAPFVKKILSKNFSIGRLSSNIVNFGSDLLDMVQNLPDDTREIIRKVRQGRLKFDFEHKGLEQPIRELHRMMDKLIVGLITVGLLVGSAIMAQIGKGPYLMGYPAVGIIGYFAAAVCVFWVMWDIFKRR